MIWDLQASAGAVGKSILWRGPWNSASSYNPYDGVSASNGSSYISKTNNQNHDPLTNPSDWDVLASAGPAGEDGPQGPEGLSGVPIGTVVDWPGPTEPQGWLFCYGQELVRTGIYADLFAAIGTTWGSLGSGSFTLPDFRGRVSAGRDDMGGTLAQRLVTVRSCNTTNASTTLTIPATYAGVNMIGLNISGPGIPVGATITAWLSTTTATMSAAATATATGVSVKFFMFDATVLGANGGDHLHQLTVSQMPAHTHGGSVTSASPFWAIAGGSSISTAGQTGSTGGNHSHPNVQPTAVVNRIIKYAHATYTLVPGTGNVVGPASAGDRNIAQFDGATGKLLLDGGKAVPSGVIIGDTDTQALSNKTFYVAAECPYRPIGVLASNPNTVLTSGSELELTHLSYTLKANMVKDGDILRLSWAGQQIDATAITRGFILRFNGLNLWSHVSAATTAIVRSYYMTLYRQSNTSIRYNIIMTRNDAASATAEVGLITVDFSIDLTIALNAYQSSTGARAQIFSSMLEFLPIP